MHWRKNKSASVTKQNKGIEGTRAQSTKQGSDSEQEIHGKGKKRPPCRQRKTRIREIIPDVASSEGEKRDIP
jgi:hypothetical protein